MKIGVRLVSFLMVLVWTIPALLQVNDSEAQIRSVMAQGRKASLEGDSDKIASLITDDYLQTDISGHVQDKSTWLKDISIPLLN